MRTKRKSWNPLNAWGDAPNWQRPRLKNETYAENRGSLQIRSFPWKWNHIRGTDYSIKPKVVADNCRNLKLGSVPLDQSLSGKGCQQEGKKRKQAGPVWYLRICSFSLSMSLAHPNSTQPAPKHHTKGCSHWFGDSPGARTLVFAALLPFLAVVFGPQKPRTPLCSRARLYTPPSPTPISGRKAFFRGGGVGVYILRPHAAGILCAPRFYTPPTPRRVISGVGVWGCINFGPVFVRNLGALSKASVDKCASFMGGKRCKHLSEGQSLLSWQSPNPRPQHQRVDSIATLIFFSLLF